MRRNIMISICGCLLLFASCTFCKNTADNIYGSATLNLQKARAQAKSQAFDSSLSDCFERTLGILGELKADILKADTRNHVIVALMHKTTLDNADVGFFFTEESAGKTRIEISSLSSVYRDYAAEAVFAKLLNQ